MLDTLRAEFRKLLTIRSTYIVTGVCLFLIVLFAFYAQGIREPGEIARNRLLFKDIVFSTVQTVGFLGAIVGMLLLSHEYRYNMITYTLTASRSRTRVLLAKAIVVSVYAVALTLALSVMAPLLTYLGAHVIQGAPVAPQELDVVGLLWRAAFVGWGYAMIGFVVTALIRNQVGAIVSFLFFPLTIEPLSSLLLKQNSMYMPFSMLQQVLGTQVSVTGTSISSVKAVAITLIYLGASGAIAWLLFMRRDAN